MKKEEIHPEKCKDCVVAVGKYCSKFNFPRRQHDPHCIYKQEKEKPPDLSEIIKGRWRI